MGEAQRSEGSKLKYEVVPKEVGDKYASLFERAKTEYDMVKRQVLRTELERLLKDEKYSVLIMNLQAMAEKDGLKVPDIKNARPAKRMTDIIDAIIPLEPIEE
jgi:hypothetical protein